MVILQFATWNNQRVSIQKKRRKQWIMDIVVVMLVGRSLTNKWMAWGSQFSDPPTWEQLVDRGSFGRYDMIWHDFTNFEILNSAKMGFKTGFDQQKPGSIWDWISQKKIGIDQRRVITFQEEFGIHGCVDHWISSWLCNTFGMSILWSQLYWNDTDPKTHMRERESEHVKI